MRSYCTGETRVEAATPSRRQPAPGNLSRETSRPSGGAKTVADAVNKLGRFDAVIHNAGIGYGEKRVEIEPGVPSVFAVNVLAADILTH
jgi:NAD(P)-dependent dehydrogenase (short-subunit alcohol dehydrogenase family)